MSAAQQTSDQPYGFDLVRDNRSEKHIGNLVACLIQIRTNAYRMLSVATAVLAFPQTRDTDALERNPAKRWFK